MIRARVFRAIVRSAMLTFASWIADGSKPTEGAQEQTPAHTFPPICAHAFRRAFSLSLPTLARQHAAALIAYYYCLPLKRYLFFQTLYFSKPYSSPIWFIVTSFPQRGTEVPRRYKICSVFRPTTIQFSSFEILIHIQQVSNKLTLRNATSATETVSRIANNKDANRFIQWKGS